MEDVRAVIGQIYSGDFDLEATVRQRRRQWDPLMRLFAEQTGIVVVREYQSVHYDWCARYTIQLGPSAAGSSGGQFVGDADSVSGAAPSLHAGLSSQAVIYISELAPYYTVARVDFRRAGAAWAVAGSFPLGDVPGHQAIAECLHSHLRTAGLELLDAEILNAHVAGVQLALSEPEDVTVLKCLFFDFDG